VPFKIYLDPFKIKPVAALKLNHLKPKGFVIEATSFPSTFKILLM
jgi:hypothetical protein